MRAVAEKSRSSKPNSARLPFFGKAHDFFAPALRLAPSNKTRSQDQESATPAIQLDIQEEEFSQEIIPTVDTSAELNTPRPSIPDFPPVTSSGIRPAANSVRAPDLEENPAMEQMTDETPTVTTAADLPAPKTPDEDPEFQTAQKQIHVQARKQKKHEPVAVKQQEALDAAALPLAEQNVQSGQEQMVDILAIAAMPKPFNRALFKKKLRDKIDSKMPRTENEAKAFAKSKKLDEAKQEFKGEIGEEKFKVTGPLERARAMDLPPGKNLKPDDIEVPSAQPAAPPQPISPDLVVPKPKSDAEISLEHKSRALDQQMMDEGITEPQLADSDEESFTRALNAKRDAQQAIAEVPERYREREEQLLANARGRMSQTAAGKLNKMSHTKTGATGKVFTSQKDRESKIEKRQGQIRAQIHGIYERTEKAVNSILDNLSRTVENTFSEDVDKANQTFTSRVRSRLKKHYGWFTFDDKIAEWAGLSKGVGHIFLQEKQLFLDTMEGTLDRIATMVETALNLARDQIEEGRTDLVNFKKTLSGDELVFAQFLLEEISEKFNHLEETIGETEDDLIDTLSDQYVESVGKLQEEFDKLDEELGASLIMNAVKFIGDVAAAIRDLGALLSSIASRIGEYINEILQSPKRFFNNLTSGITSGMDEFKQNIGTYLEKGFWQWLTGSAASVNIQIPDKMNAEGMFGLAMQILGFTRETLWEKIRKKLKMPIEKLRELFGKAESTYKKLIEPVELLLTRGAASVWEWIKKELAPKLEEIFGGIKEEIFNTIIRKFLIWLGTLFIPGLGFVKLIQAAYKALKWLVDNISRIAELVNTLLDSIGLAVQGNVATIKEKVVRALTLGVVIAIDFLARLVGLGDFKTKLQKALDRLRKPINIALDFLLDRARPVVTKIRNTVEKAVKKAQKGAKRVVDKGKRVVDRAKKAVGKRLGWGWTRKAFKTEDGATHHVFVEKQGAKSQLMVASDKTEARKLLGELRKKFAGDPEKLAEIDRAFDSILAVELNIREIEKLHIRKPGLQNDPDNTNRDPERDKLYDNLMVMETVLTTRLYYLMKGEDFKSLLSLYAIEGQVGVHNAGPKKRGMFEADHQPSNKVLTLAAALPAAPPLLRQIANTRSKWATTITLGKRRHMKGRTWGDGAKVVANSFEKVVLPEMAKTKDPKGKAAILEKALQKEAWNDAEHMVNLVKKAPQSSEEIWGDIKGKPNAKDLREAIIKQIEHGESIIKFQKVSIPL